MKILWPFCTLIISIKWNRNVLKSAATYGDLFDTASSQFLYEESTLSHVSPVYAFLL